MALQIDKMRQMWREKDIINPSPELSEKLLSFRLNSGLMMPEDLVEYFTLLDNFSDKMDSNLYQFYGMDEFKSIDKELAHWGGIPDYRNIVNTLKQCENCFVIADYMLSLFAYAIRLYPEETEVNEIYIICGDKNKVIANSLSEFLDLYFDDSIELQFT